MLPGIRTRRLVAAAALATVAFPLSGVVLAGSALAAPASASALAPAAGSAPAAVVSETGLRPAQTDDQACAAYADQSAAQAALDAGAGDAALLDADHDGRACEDHPYPADPTPVRTRPPAPSEAQVPLVPVGAVPAGDGSAAALQDSPTMATTLDRAGGAAFVGGIAMVVALAAAGIATLALSGRMLLAGVRTGTGSERDPDATGTDTPIVPAPRRAPEDDTSDRPLSSRAGHDAHTPDPTPPMVGRTDQHVEARR